MVFIFWIKRKTKIKWLLRHAVICAHSGLIWFWISRRMEPLWTTSSRVKLLAQLKTGFLCLRGMSCVCPLCLYFCHLSQWEKFVSILFKPSHQIFMWIDSTPLSCSMLKCPGSVSFSSYDRCSRPLIIFMVLCWTYSNVSDCLFFKHGAQH